MSTERNDSPEDRINKAVSQARKVMGSEKKVSQEELKQVFQGFSQKERVLINFTVLQRIDNDINKFNATKPKNFMEKMRFNNQKEKYIKERERVVERQSLLSDLQVKAQAGVEKFNAAQLEQTVRKIVVCMKIGWEGDRRDGSINKDNVKKIIDQATPELRSKISKGIEDYIKNLPAGEKPVMSERFTQISKWVVDANNNQGKTPVEASKANAPAQSGPSRQPKSPTPRPTGRG